MMMKVQRNIAVCISGLIGQRRECPTRPKELKVTRFDKEVFRYEGIPQPVMCGKSTYRHVKYLTSCVLPKIEEWKALL